MAQFEVLAAFARDIPVNHAELLRFSAMILVPLLNDQYRLNHYADQCDSSAVCVVRWSRPHFTQQLSQTIEQLIQALG